MALNAYDASKHHIALGPNAEYGFLLDRAYSKSARQEVAPSGDYGGVFDLIARDVPDVNRWTQDDFTGGAFQYRFEKDLAMFADCTGYIPAQQSRSLITVPPVILKHPFDVSAQSNPGARTDITAPKAMFTIAGSIYVLFTHGILRYRQDNDTVQWGNWLVDANHYYADAGYDLNEQIIYVLLNTTLTTDAPRLLRISPTTLDTTPYAIGAFDPLDSSGADLVRTKGKVGKGIQVQSPNIVTGIGLRLYTCAPPADVTDNLSRPTWTEIGRLPGYWVDSVAYNGMTYILCGTVDGRTQLVAFDGTAVLPISDFPFNFRGHCMTVYGGRVYVGGSGTDISGAVRYAELYEVTGSSVRLVRTFAPESYQSRVTWPRQIWDMTVDEGLLWFSEKGKRMWAYDLTSDAFFGASEIQQTSMVLFKQVVGRERLWAWGTHDSDATKHGLYRVAIAGDVPSGYTPQIVTSDFLPEPALVKNWDKIVVLSRYAAVNSVEYSIDGGQTWGGFDAALFTIEQFGDLWYTTCDLNGLASSKSIRFRLEQPMGTTVATYGELIAFTTSFTFSSSSSGLKHGWSFQIAVTEAIEGRDGSTVSQDVAATAAQLWDWADNKTLLSFRDVDDQTYAVRIQALTESQPIIGPDAETRPEAFFSVTLLER